MLKIVVALYLCWAIILVSGNGSISKQPVEQPSSNQSLAEVISPPEPTVFPNPPITTEKPPPSSSTTTVKPPPSNSTTTVEPPPSNSTTTTVEPPPSNSTTTVEPPPSNSTTTVKPTSPSPVTPTPIPVTTTPLPAPKDGTWVVNNTNETCIVIRMAVKFDVIYSTKDNKTQHKLLTLPTANGSTIVTGECGTTEQTINITWHAGNDSLIIHFVKNETTKRYFMHHLELYLGSHEFPDGDTDETLKFVHEVDEFSIGLTNSYRCMRLQKLDLTRNDTNGTLGSIEISDLQFQAFKSDKASNFGFAQDCASDVPDVVPIAVGCALTVLVIIILVAYLVGRRRSQARGYLSM